MKNMLSFDMQNWNTWSDDGTEFDYQITNDNSCVYIKSNKSFFSVVSHRIELADDAMYEFSADVLIEDGEDAKAYLSVTLKDAAGNWKGHCDTPVVTKKGEWVHISKRIFGVIQPNINFSIYLRGSNASAKFKNLTLCEFNGLNYASNEVIEKELSATDIPNKNTLMGFGAEVDPEFFEPFNRSFMEDPDAEFAFLKERMREVNFPFARVMLLPTDYEREKGNINLDGERCQGLIKQLNAFEELGVHVVLTWWCVPRKEMPWLAFPAEHPWCSPPTDSEYAAESLATFLEMLLDKYHYTCIKDIILINEPNEAYITDKGIDFEHYAGFCRNFDAALKRHNLREKFSIIGSDDTSSYEWYKNCVEKLDDVFDGYDSHVYRWNIYDEKIDTEIQEFVNDRVKLTDKRFFIGEFGSETACSKQESAQPHKGLFAAALAINTTKAGSSGISYWTLFEVYYGKALMGMGLWKSFTEGWAMKPAALVWRMLSKYTSKGDKIYPIENDGMIDAVAFVSENNETTVAVLNRSFNTVDLTLSNIKFNSKPYGLVYDKNNVKPDQYYPDDFNIEYKEKLSCVMKPESFVIITDRNK